MPCLTLQSPEIENSSCMFQSGNHFPQITNKSVSKNHCQVQAPVPASLNGLCQYILIHPTSLCQLHCWLDTDEWHCSVPLQHFINNTMLWYTAQCQFLLLQWLEWLETNDFPNKAYRWILDSGSIPNKPVNKVLKHNEYVFMNVNILDTKQIDCLNVPVLR